MSECEKPAPKSAGPSTPSSAKSKSTARAKGYRPPVVEETPVIGGRYLIAAGIIGALTLFPHWSALGQALEPKEPPTSKIDE
jgi:hypothetical protein